MFIAVAAYQIAYRGMGAAAANDCSQNKTQQIVFVLHYIYYICRVIYKLWQTYKKKYRTRVFISRKLTHMLLCVLIFTCSLVSIIYSMVVQATVNFRRILRCPRQYHVCVLLQWCILHGISVLLYVESAFCSAIINYHSSHPVFSPPNPQKTLVPERKISRSDRKTAPPRQKIRPPVTENPALRQP